MAQTVARTLGYKQEAGRSFTETLVAHLARRPALLVLDNCEHVLAASADLAEALLRGCPAVTILATSREPLRVPSEVAWRVPSMSLPGEGTPVRIDTLTQYEAVQLFVDPAVRARASFAVTVTNENAPAVAGGFTLEAAQDVCWDGVLDLLTQLVDKSLVLMEESGDAARHRMLETVRQYGAERLADAGERDEVRDRHLGFFVGLAERAEPLLIGPEQDRWMARLDLEHDNVRPAWQ